MTCVHRKYHMTCLASRISHHPDSLPPPPAKTSDSIDYPSYHTLQAYMRHDIQTAFLASRTRINTRMHNDPCLNSGEETVCGTPSNEFTRACIVICSSRTDEGACNMSSFGSVGASCSNHLLALPTIMSKRRKCSPHHRWSAPSKSQTCRRAHQICKTFLHCHAFSTQGKYTAFIRRRADQV